MKKIYLYSRWKKKKLIIQKFFLLCIVSCRSILSSPSPVPSTSLTDFLHVAIYYSWLGHSSILSQSSTSCIMHCIIFHTILQGFPNKEAPTFKSINNINKCIKYPSPIILKYKIKIIPKRKKMESEHSFKLNHTVHC